MSYCLTEKSSYQAYSDGFKSAAQIGYDSQNNRLWIARGRNAADHVKVLSFDGNSFSLVASNSVNEVFLYAAYAKDNWFFASASNGYIIAMTIVNGTIVKKYFNLGATLGLVYDIFVDTNGLIYVGLFNCFKILAFDGNTFAVVATISTGKCNVVLGALGDVYSVVNTDTPDQGKINRGIFNGLSYLYQNTSGNLPGQIYGICYNGSYLVVGVGLTLSAYNASTFEPIGNPTTISAHARRIKFDGYYYYVQEEDSRMGVYTFNGTDFTLVSSLNYGIPLRSVASDFGNGYSFFIDDDVVYATKMTLSASFVADKPSAKVGDTITFTVVP
jgi:hypothetical protein